MKCFRNGEIPMIKVGFKRLTDDAVLPVRAHYSDSGFDLFANEDVVIQPGETEVIKTGIAVHLPEGYEAQVRPRSGVTSKTKLRVQLGTIDNDYTGQIGILVDNIERSTTMAGMNVDGSINEDIKYKYGRYAIRKGDKLAQLVIQELPPVHAYEIEELPTTPRGSNGFGSSGY